MHRVEVDLLSTWALTFHDNDASFTFRPLVTSLHPKRNNKNHFLTSPIRVIWSRKDTLCFVFLLAQYEVPYGSHDLCAYKTINKSVPTLCWFHKMKEAPRAQPVLLNQPAFTCRDSSNFYSHCQAVDYTNIVRHGGTCMVLAHIAFPIPIWNFICMLIKWHSNNKIVFVKFKPNLPQALCNEKLNSLCIKSACSTP